MPTKPSARVIAERARQAARTLDALNILVEGKNSAFARALGKLNDLAESKTLPDTEDIEDYIAAAAAAAVVEKVQEFLDKDSEPDIKLAELQTFALQALVYPRKPDSVMTSLLNTETATIWGEVYKWCITRF